MGSGAVDSTSADTGDAARKRIDLIMCSPRSGANIAMIPMILRTAVKTKGGANCVATAAFGPTLPTWALQQVGSYLGYTGRAANVFATGALDPKATSLEY